MREIVACLPTVKNRCASAARTSVPGGRRLMTVPAAAPTSRPQSRVSPMSCSSLLLAMTSPAGAATRRDRQLRQPGAPQAESMPSTGDRRETTIYDTANEPDGVLRIPCGNRREQICPACSEVYKGDSRRSSEPGCRAAKASPKPSPPIRVFAALTAPGFGPVHTIRTGRGGRRRPAVPPRRPPRRCPHGRDLSCPRHHCEDDPRLGTPMCPDCYDYSGHVLFNALAPELCAGSPSTCRASWSSCRDHPAAAPPRDPGPLRQVSNTSTAASSTTTWSSGSTPRVTLTSLRRRVTPPSCSTWRSAHRGHGGLRHRRRHRR